MRFPLVALFTTNFIATCAYIAIHSAGFLLKFKSSVVTVERPSLCLIKLNKMPRLAKLQDIHGLSKLYRELRPDDPEIAGPTSLTQLGELIDHPNIHLIVKEVDTVLVSTCMLAIIPNLAHGGKPFGVIEHVVTLSAHQRLGYSRAVLEKALELAWAANCYKVMLLSGVGRSGAHRFYESLGFNGAVERGFVIKPK